MQAAAAQLARDGQTTDCPTGFHDSQTIMVTINERNILKDNEEVISVILLSEEGPSISSSSSSVGGSGGCGGYRNLIPDGPKTMTTKTLKATKVEEYSKNLIPAHQAAPGSDPQGGHRDETSWHY
jgi:hypothetical protein